MVNRKIEISKEEICMYLHVPITEASAKLGISISVLKKRCRDFGIRRWPYRKIKSYEKKVSNLEQNLLRNPEKSFEIATQIQRFSRKRAAAISHPEKITSQGVDVDLTNFGLLENGTEIEDRNFFKKIHSYRNESNLMLSEGNSPFEGNSAIMEEEEGDLSDVELLLSLSAGNGKVNESNNESENENDNESEIENDNEIICGDGDVVVLPPCSSFDLIPPTFTF